MSMENISETIEEWYEKAILFNNNWQYLMTAMECTPRDNCSTGQNQNYQNNSQYQDPDTMDINIMSAKYQKLFKEVKCFNFQKQGY